MPAKDLVSRLDGLGAGAFEGTAFRHVAPGYDPLATAGARIRGGRWNPPESFGVIYLGLDRETVEREFRRAAARHGLQPEDFLPRDLHELRVRLGAVLDLPTEGSLETVGLDLTRVQSENANRCQAIGEAAHYLGLEAIRAPSATGAGEVLAVLFDRVRPDSVIEVIGSDELTF